MDHETGSEGGECQVSDFPKATGQCRQARDGHSGLSQHCAGPPCFPDVRPLLKGHRTPVVLRSQWLRANSTSPSLVVTGPGPQVGVTRGCVSW